MLTIVDAKGVCVSVNKISRRQGSTKHMRYIPDCGELDKEAVRIG